MIVIELVPFMVALLAIWWARRQQLRSLEQQQFLLRRFADAVTIWRSKVGLPADARQAIELLVDIPISRKVVQRFAVTTLRNQTSPKLEDNPFWLVRNQLSNEEREAFDWLMVTFFLAFTYGDWLAGSIIRSVRFGGLSRQTQAEVAVETVFSRGMGRASHASA